MSLYESIQSGIESFKGTNALEVFRTTATGIGFACWTNEHGQFPLRVSHRNRTEKTDLFHAADGEVCLLPIRGNGSIGCKPLALARNG